MNTEKNPGDPRKLAVTQTPVKDHKLMLESKTCMEQNNEIRKENEKIDKYLDLARELKKLWNINMTETPILVGSFETSLKTWKRLRPFRSQNC